MNCETAFSRTSVSGRCLFEGSSPLGTDLRVTDLYTVGSFDPDHDAVMRIGGEAPGGVPILTSPSPEGSAPRPSGTGGLQTHRWREMDSNLQFRDALAPATAWRWCDAL